jgi:hypothetical protein
MRIGWGRFPYSPKTSGPRRWGPVPAYTLTVDRCSAKTSPSDSNSLLPGRFTKEAISHQMRRVNATEAFRLHQITHSPTRTKLGTLADAEMRAKTLLSR